MSYNGSGVAVINSAGQPVAANTLIDAAVFNALTADLASMLSTAICRDGQTTVTGNIPMAGFRFTGLGAGAAIGQSLRYEQLFSTSAIQLLGAMEWVKGADIASATTLNLTTATGNGVHVTGTTTITGVTLGSGMVRLVIFDGALTLTHHATNNNLPGAANITTAAGDRAIYWADGTTVYCMLYQPAAGYLKYVAPGASGNVLTSNGTAWTSAAPASGKINDFRLTLESGVPVSTSDQTGKTTVYCCPYVGNQISLYDGSGWNTRTSAQFSLALGTLTSGKPYDVFCYDNAGTPTLEFLVWTNDTTRATALAYQDGVLCKTGALTRRYLGTFYTTATTTTEDSASKRYLYNYYNRVRRSLVKTDSTASWTYVTGSYQQARASAANQVEAIQGMAEDVVDITVSTHCSISSGSGVSTAGVGIDSTTVNSAQQISTTLAVVSAAYGTSVARYKAVPTAGRHYYAWLEIGGANLTIYGGATGEGLIGEVMA